VGVALLVIGHRGASAYRPENTLEAFELAFRQGADAIECDIVATRDGELIIRHEPELVETTTIDGNALAHDLLLEDISKLRAIERLPELRPGSAKFDGEFKIPTLNDLLTADFVNGKSLVLEVKQSPNVVPLFIDELKRSNITDRARVIIESFEFEDLATLRAGLGDGFEYVYVMDEWDAKNAFDFDGISLDFALIAKMPEVVEAAKAKRLSVYGWTARVEEAETSVEEYFHHLVATGVDGIFADHPDLLRTFVDGNQ